MSNTPAPRIYQDLVTYECVCEYCGSRERDARDPMHYSRFLEVHRQCLPNDALRKLGHTANQKALMNECLEIISRMKRQGNINVDDLNLQVAENSPQPYIPQHDWVAFRYKLIALLNTIKDL